MSDKNNDIDTSLRDELERDARRRIVLASLLDAQREKAGHIFALKAHMGITHSYITSVPLSWVESNIQFAADLPLFENHADLDSKKVSVNQDTVDLLQQRAPDWRRQLPMSVYLAERENHKFPPLLIVCYQKWAYQTPLESDNWGPDGRAIKPSVPIMSLDNNGAFLDIADSETSYYALDGQHRLMAIKGLKELLNNRRLYARKQNGENTAKFIPLNGEGENTVVNSIIKRRRNQERSTNKTEILEGLQSRMKETIGIEIIPAVQERETQKEALSRLRQIFVDVNEQAKPPTMGENIMLDNSIGFRAVARSVMVSHDLLSEGKTSETKAQLSETSECYTTVQMLAEITQKYLEQIGCEHWATPVLKDRRFGYIRPPDEEIKDGISVMTEYFDALSKLPSHVRFVQATEENRWKLRSKPEKDDPDPMLLDNILFRPIAQSALAKAIGEILVVEEIPKSGIREKLDDIVVRMAKQEKRGMLQLRNIKSPWYGVLCDPVDEKMRRHTQNQKLCQRLFVYLLCGLGELDILCQDFAEARKTASNKSKDLNGKDVPLGDIKLPNRWE